MPGRKMAMATTHARQAWRLKEGGKWGRHHGVLLALSR